MSEDSLIEVTLVDDVRGCRSCRWFWADIPPYGPHLSWEWDEAYPEAMKETGVQSTRRSREPFLQANAVDPAQIDPAVMHGCRKAPIMTIGINPNMTSYFPSETASEWAYPHFSEASQYAYYYRYQTLYQESFDREALLHWMQTDAESEQQLVAQKRGWLLSSRRSKDHRWLEIEYCYEGEEQIRRFETSWSLQEKAVVLVNRGRKGDSRVSFEQGDTIVGRIRGEAAENLTVYKNSVTYYQRFIPVLERFKAMIGGELADANLRVGEDVAQHDMIHCASPGWSTAYDIPTDAITRHCVQENAFVLKQLLQSQPALIYIVGGSSLAMFAEALGPYLDFDYEEERNGAIQIKDVYQLLIETSTRECLLTIDIDDFFYQARVVVVPHFSYSDNYVAQCRLPPDAWEAFCNHFPDDLEILKLEQRLHDPAWNGIIPVSVHSNDVDLQKKMSVQAWNILMCYFVDPTESMAGVMAQEFHAGKLKYDRSRGVLARSSGNCQYCVNDQWQFPEGCLYGNDGQPRNYGNLDNIVQKITAAMES